MARLQAGLSLLFKCGFPEPDLILSLPEVSREDGSPWPFQESSCPPAFLSVQAQARDAGQWATQSILCGEAQKGAGQVPPEIHRESLKPGQEPKA